MILPESQDKLLDHALSLIEDCRVSQAARTQLARSLKQWKYTGSSEGNVSILNYLGHHIDRMASYLFSPSDLRFHIEFENQYSRTILNQAEAASRMLTRSFERRDVDLQFAEAVDLALTHGSCISKLMWTHGGMTCRLVMPWQFGVYREDENDISMQEAVCETTYITAHDFWRRISHLPDAVALFKRAKDHARKKTANDGADTFFHQVLLAGTSPIVQTEAPFLAAPGGMVNVSADPVGAIMSPEVAGGLLTFHELTVIDDERGDYTTIQVVEPDILVAPRYRRKNLFVPEYLPYSLIQPNKISGYFWGRSEIADLMKLQNLLRDRLEDIKKIMSLQYDRLLAFTGFSGMNDEKYDAFKEAGYIANEMPGSKVEDLTPQLPQAAFADIEKILEFMDMVSGFKNVLSGQGEPGVRAGSHAQMLMRTASPRMRDRALLVERQCSDIGEKAFELMAAKEARAYWTEEGNPESDFLLSQLPDDRRVTVDSHSSSPIYEQDHQQMAAFLAKAGVIDGESILDLMPVPMRDLLKDRWRKKQQQQAELIKQHPELLQKGRHHRAA